MLFPRFGIVVGITVAAPLRRLHGVALLVDGAAFTDGVPFAFAQPVSRFLRVAWLVPGLDGGGPLAGVMPSPLDDPLGRDALLERLGEFLLSTELADLFRVQRPELSEGRSGGSLFRPSIRNRGRSALPQVLFKVLFKVQV